MNGIWTHAIYRDGSEACLRHDEFWSAHCYAEEEAEWENTESVTLRVNGNLIEKFQGFFAT